MQGISKEDAEIYAEGIRRGGAVVEDILARHHIVDLPRRADSYRERGWNGFDPDTTVPYTQAEIEAERQRHGLPLV